MIISTKKALKISAFVLMFFLILNYSLNVKILFDSQIKILSYPNETVNIKVTYDPKCFQKIEYNNKLAMAVYVKNMINNSKSVFNCAGIGEIAPNDNIIEIEEKVPKQYNSLDILETYVFKLKENRLKDIYGLNYGQVSCNMRNFSKIEGNNEGNF